MTWNYLLHPALQVRHVVAAHFLRGCRCVIEIGGYKAPITSFLSHPVDEVVVIDPLIDPEERNELDGRPCRVRHLKIDLDDFDLDAWLHKSFGAVFLGMDLDFSEKSPSQMLNTVSRLVRLISHSQVAVLEYSIRWKPSTSLFNLILSILQPRIAVDMKLDLSNYGNDLSKDDEVCARLLRRLVVLKDMERPADVELRERAARILFGSEGAKVALAGGKDLLQERADAFDLRDAKLGYNKATVEYRGDLWVRASPEPWSYAALVPLNDQLPKDIAMSGPTPAIVEVKAYIDEGALGFGVLDKNMREIVGERFLKAKRETLQSVDLFIPDLRGQFALICRNASLEGIASTGRIVSAKLYA